MPARMLAQAIEQLDSAGASMRCAEITKLLQGLGFEVRDGKRGGHKVFFHDHIKDFLSGSYNCDHGKNPEIKRPYIRQVLAILRQHEAELTRYLESKNE